ncbi:MAG: hypothetical protein Q8S03_10240 [Brevundimonas sp.]|uniref:hypothetical protein n=1 Tax=Brevundimonas sp. TaxID=1871086 RepID=UPI0027366C97|nr:hypothetical protein [Brevundimonas sp.]MDP3405058.1 hypothetical protein [Brevundimonas sp.]
MTFIEREKDEPLAMHMHRNADALGASSDQRARLRQAAALCLKGSAPIRKDTRAGATDRIAAIVLATEVRDELAASAQTAVYVAQAHGETVEPYNEDGAVRVSSRDGLWSALFADHVTEHQYNGGMEYRALVEHVASSGGSSQLANVSEVRGGGGGADAAQRRGLHRAYAGIRVTDAEAAVQAADRSGRALLVLRAVAGEGRTVSSLGKGNARVANLRALGLALDIVCRALSQSGGLRITGT